MERPELGCPPGSGRVSWPARTFQLIVVSLTLSVLLLSSVVVFGQAGAGTVPSGLGPDQTSLTGHHASSPSSVSAGSGQPGEQQAVGSTSPNGSVSTLILSNNSLVPGNFIPPSFNTSSYNVSDVAYDSADGTFYFTNLSSRDLTVVNASSQHRVAFVKCCGGEPDYPGGFAFDPLQNELATGLGGDVVIVNATTNEVVNTLGYYSATHIRMLAYDSASKSFLGTMGWNRSAYLTINQSNITAGNYYDRPSPGGNCLGIAFDSSNDYVYLSAFDGGNSGNITVLNGTSYEVVGSTSVGGAPGAITFDEENGLIYALNGSGVSIFDGLNLVTFVQLNAIPSDLAVNPQSGQVFVTTANNTVAIIADEALDWTISVGLNPQGIAFDSNGTGYVADASSGTITLVSYEPYTEYTVEFQETGLPPGTNWSVNLSAVPSESDTPTIEFLAPNGLYQFQVGPVLGYSSMPDSGNVSVNNYQTIQPIVFTPGTSTFPVTFNETGLPYYSGWQVDVAGVTPVTSYSASTTIILGNGTYSYTVNASDILYAPLLSRGSFTVAGIGLIEQVTFFEPVFGITFVETGLPSSMNWSVLLQWGANMSNGYSRTSTVNFSEHNRDGYQFFVGQLRWYSVSPSTGFFVVDGGPVQLNLTFTHLINETQPGTPSPPLDWSSIELYAFVAGLAAVGAVAVTALILVRRQGKVPPK